MKEATIATVFMVAWLALVWYGVHGIFWCAKHFGTKPVLICLGIVCVIAFWVWALVISGEDYDIRRIGD